MASDMNLASQGHASGVVGGADDEEVGLDVLGFLRRRKWFVIILSLLGIGLSYLVFERQVPRYRSSALVQVIHSAVDNQLPTMVSERDLSDAAFVIPSPSILMPAVETHQLNQLHMFSGLTAAEAAERLAGMISVKTPSRVNAGSNVIEILCEGKNSADTAKIANAVASQYIKAQMANYTDARVELEKLLSQTRDDLHNELKIKEREYDEFRKNSRLMSDGKNPHRARHQDLLDEISKLRIRQTTLQSQLTALEEAAKNGASREAMLLLVERSGVMRPEVKKPPMVTPPSDSANEKEMEEYERLLAEAEREEEEARIAAKAEAANARLAADKYVAEGIFPLRVELDLLKAKHGPDHPKVAAQIKKIELTEAHLRSVSNLISKKASPPPKSKTPIVLPKPEQPERPRETPTEQPVVDDELETEEAYSKFLAAYQESLQQELLTVSKSRQELESQAATEEQLARTLMQDEILDRNKLKEMDRLTQLFEEHLEKIRETKVNANVGKVKAQILTPARVGDLVFPLMTHFLGLGACLGAFLGMAIGYLVEVADRSFRQPDDVVREFHLPIMGHIPYTKEGDVKKVRPGSTFDKMAVCVHLPRSRAAEAFRSVRTAICFSALGSSHRVIQITSPTAGDGKSTLALNLSVAMAISGRKTILIECDLRRPTVHKLSGVSNTKGIVDVLEGNIELSDAIQKTEIDNFFVMPGGSRTKNPAELLVQPRFGQLLQVLRDKFEYVIVDTPPVLVVTDPCGVAAQVDGVIVAMRLGRHTRSLGRRTLEQLRDVGATISGLVVNGVEDGDTYGYAAYRYADYRGYSTGYTYSDQKGGADGYYTDTEADGDSEPSDSQHSSETPAGSSNRKRT